LVVSNSLEELRRMISADSPDTARPTTDIFSGFSYVSPSILHSENAVGGELCESTVDNCPNSAGHSCCKFKNAIGLQEEELQGQRKQWEELWEAEAARGTPAGTEDAGTETPRRTATWTLSARRGARGRTTAGTESPRRGAAGTAEDGTETPKRTTARTASAGREARRGTAAGTEAPRRRAAPAECSTVSGDLVKILAAVPAAPLVMASLPATHILIFCREEYDQILRMVPCFWIFISKKFGHSTRNSNRRTLK
jgi:hypothetical protein